jgi:hypothetical protein
MAARKTTRRKATRKKATRKKATRKKAAGRTTSARARRRAAFARIESELPPNLREFSRRVQRGLANIEKQIETAQRDARQRWTRLRRDLNRQLGRIEAAGEKRGRAQTKRAREDALKALKRLERAIEASGRPRKKKKKTARRKARA